MGIAATYTGKHRKPIDWTSAASIDAALNLAEVDAYLAAIANGE